jgi:uncharacterized protein (TIGR03437 family)
MRLSAILYLLLTPGVILAQTNLDFESGGTVGATPPGWFYGGSVANVYRGALTSSGCLQGRFCMLLTGPSTAPAGSFGNLSQSLQATRFRGQVVRFRVALRVTGDATARARLWIRTDRANGTSTGIVNSPDILPSGEWRYYAANLTVTDDTTSLIFGVLNYSGASVLVDDGSFDGLQLPPPEASRTATTNGVNNLAAFAQVLGYVRHFHPSDQSERVDWDSFAAHGVRTVEDAETPQELASRLQTLFDPIAPTVRIFPAGSRPDLPPELRPESTVGMRLVQWEHYGAGIGSVAYYRSRRVTAEAPAEPYEAPIGRGLAAFVPLALYADANGTLPPRPAPAFRCCAVTLDDRATRIGSVILAWNVAQHFYPYFDVIDTDWSNALLVAIRGAATDRGADDFLVTISRLWAALKDGHGFVTGPQTYPMVPLVWEWTEEQLIVTLAKTGAQGIVRGDRVLRIDGEPVEEKLAYRESLISGATPQWIRWRALQQMAYCRDASRNMQVEVEPYAAPGTRRTVLLNCGSDATWQDPRPKVVQELEPGIFYVDISNLTETDWNANAAAIASAKGVVFDLRGYPRIVNYLQHFQNSVTNSAQWHVPTPSKPDRAGMTFFRAPSWELPPAAPQIGGKRVFLTDGRAISFAESVMGIIEAYRFAEIVGAPSAGTNGNINYVLLPGGFSLGFTGMKVLKHDGTTHHGIAIRPTIPAARTRKGVAEGRDEVLARGIEIVKGAPAGPTPVIRSVTHGATFAEGPAAAGEIVAIFGENLGPAETARTTYDGSGFLGTYAGETRVFFDNVQAPLMYASATQVGAIVPYGMSRSARVRVEYQLRGSEPVTVEIAGAAPGLFGTAVNADGTFNAESNPAARGSVVTLFATGTGATTPPTMTGRLPRDTPAPAGTVTVTIGGRPAEVIFKGEIAAGVLQLNVRAPEVSAGAQSAVLSIDGAAGKGVPIYFK